MYKYMEQFPSAQPSKELNLYRRVISPVLWIFTRASLSYDDWLSAIGGIEPPYSRLFLTAYPRLR